MQITQGQPHPPINKLPIKTRQPAVAEKHAVLNAITLKYSSSELYKRLLPI